MATYTQSYADLVRQNVHNSLRDSINNPGWQQAQNTLYAAQQQANLQNALGQQQAAAAANLANTQAAQIQQSQAAEAYRAYSGNWPDVIEEVEEEVVKEVYKAEFSLRRFLDKLMTLPIALIDRLAALA